MYKIFAFIIIFLFSLFSFSAFTVKEGQKGVILRFNRVLCDKNNNPIVYGSGLHFKIPFIDVFKVLDSAKTHIKKDSILLNKCIIRKKVYLH